MAVRARYSARNRSLAGMSLIEVMVAVLILSVGLLGMGTMLAVSLRNTQSAGYRTQAANVAYEYTELMRGYISRGSNSQAEFLARSGFSSPSCDISAPPSYPCGEGAAALACDALRIADRACRSLPEGRIRANMARLGGAAQRVTLTVDVCWFDDRSETAVTTGDCSSPSETLFSLTTEM
jgi:type IV pilus assembly protein PilV